MGVFIIITGNQIHEKNDEIAMFPTRDAAHKYLEKKKMLDLDLGIQHIDKEEYFLLQTIHQELGQQKAFEALGVLQEFKVRDDFNHAEYHQMLKEFNAAYGMGAAYVELGCHFQDEVLTYLGITRKGEYLAAYLADTDPKTFTATSEKQRPKIANMIGAIRQSLSILENDLK